MNSDIVKKAYASFLSNIAVAWCSAGVIGPFFIRDKTPAELVSFITVGIIGSYLCMEWSIKLLKDLEKI